MNPSIINTRAARMKNSSLPSAYSLTDESPREINRHILYSGNPNHYQFFQSLPSHRRSSSSARRPGLLSSSLRLSQSHHPASGPASLHLCSTRGSAHLSQLDTVSSSSRIRVRSCCWKSGASEILRNCFPEFVCDKNICAFCFCT